jgi:CDP-diacylglycerol---glycerol-3-phosphate 3-phosphatidyltransferase
MGDMGDTGDMSDMSDMFARRLTESIPDFLPMVWRFAFMTCRGVLNVIPNALSVSRILLGAAFPFVPNEWRLWVILVAALTDAVDGPVARWLRSESDTGRLLDPLADKFFILVLVGTMLAEGMLHPLWALGLATRDLVVLAGLGYTIARRQWAVGRRMRPSLPGKCTTAGQFAVLLVLVARGSAPVWLLVTVSSLSVFAGLHYSRNFARLHAGRANLPASE